MVPPEGMSHSAVSPVSHSQESLAAANTPVATGQHVPHHNPEPDANGKGLIEMLMHRTICGFGALNRLVDHLVTDCHATVHHRGEAQPGFPDLVSGDPGGGGKQRVSVIRQLIHIISNGLRGLLQGVVHGFAG